jgi:lysophospholipase L1-like esterase
VRGRAAAAALLAASVALAAPFPAAAGFPPPERLEAEILRFEAADRAAPPREGAVLVLGSSSIRLWHERLDEDLAPLTIVPRGFGGSTVHDCRFFLGRVVLPYRPRAIVLYQGDNDLAWGATPEEFLAAFEGFVRAVHDRLPGTRFYVLAIKPSPSRAAVWPAAQEANRRLRRACETDPLLTFVDVATPMLDGEGRARRDLFLFDRLHMNRKGYRIWRDVLRPILLEAEAAFEDPAGRPGAGPAGESGLDADPRG